MRKIGALLRQQSTHSAVVLAVILVFAAQAAGVDVVGLTNRAGELMVAIAGASLAAKGLLPDAPHTPPVQLTEAAVRGLERLGAALPPTDPPA